MGKVISAEYSRPRTRKAATLALKHNIITSRSTIKPLLHVYNIILVLLITKDLPNKTKRGAENHKMDFHFETEVDHRGKCCDRQYNSSVHDQTKAAALYI